MTASRYVHVQIDEILRATEKAFLVLHEGAETWLPFSQVADPQDYQPGDVDLQIAVAEWLAKEKGLEVIEP